MNSLPFKQTIKSSLHSFGLYARRLRRDKFPGVLVLAYHGIPDDDLPNGSLPFGNLHVRAGEFEAHCRLLKEFCHPISAEDLRQARNQKLALPDRPVLMTFDDGYRSVYTNASPILKKYGIPAVFFVCSEPVEHEFPWPSQPSAAQPKSFRPRRAASRKKGADLLPCRST